MRTAIELNNQPFNIDLISLSENDIKTLQETKSLGIFDSTKTNFDPDGLFSTQIYGRVGTEYRNRIFSYINLKLPILHPLIYKSIIDVGSIYEGIMKSTEYVVWDNKIKNFVKSNVLEGQTGYEYFISHLNEIKFEETSSITRKFKIDTIYSAIEENKHLMKYCLVIPAGLRDYVLGDDGRPQEDDINKLYRKLLNQSFIIINTNKNNLETYNNIRYNMQKVVYEIYEYIKNLLEGKNKLIQGKWMARKTFNSTRNVATPNIEKSSNINDPTRLKYNETFVGLHQFLRSVSPLTLHNIKTKYLKNVFIGDSSIAILTDVNTLKKVQVTTTDIQKDYDLWLSNDGLDKIIENYENIYTRHDYITLGNNKYYLGLIYQDDKGFKFLQDIDDVIEGIDKNKIRPITITEFLYMSVYELDGKIPAFITRYPVSNFGSIYPSILRLKTTTKSKILNEYDDEFNLTDKVASFFPIKDIDFYNTTSVHPSHNSRLTLDFDGDTLSVQAVMSDEAKEEVFNYLKSPDYYFDTENQLNFSIETVTLNSVLAYMTS